MYKTIGMTCGAHSFHTPRARRHMKWVTGIKKAQENERKQQPQSTHQPTKQSEASAQIHGQATSHEWQASEVRKLSPQMRGLTQSPVARVTNTPTGDPEARRMTGYKQRLAN